MTTGDQTMRTDITRNRPIRVTKHSVNHQRCRARRIVLQSFGVGSREAHLCARKAERFAAKLAELGQPIEPHADLAKPLRGGWPLVNTPFSRLRSERYAWLRAHGWDSYEACRGAKSDGTFEFAKRRIAAGLGYV
jgi:hypothetical protein